MTRRQPLVRSPAARGPRAFRAGERAFGAHGALLGLLALATLSGIARGDDGLAAALQHELAGEPPALVARLLDERVVVLSGAGATPQDDPGQVRAVVLFAMPRDRVLQLLVQTTRQIEFRPDLKKLEVVERFPDGEVDLQEMRMMLMRISSWLRYQWDVPAGRISWSLDPRFPNDLRTVEGSWELEEIDAGHTLGRFGTRVDVGPALPALFEEIATRKNLPQTLDRCRRWIDSDGSSRP